MHKVSLFEAKYWTRIYSHRFFKDNLISLFLGLGVHALNYAQVLLSLRMLTTNEFGRLNALVSFLLLFSVIGNAIQLHVARILAGLGQEAGKSYLTRFELWIVGASCPVFAILAICADHLAVIYKVRETEIMTFALVAVAMLLASLGQAATSAYGKVKFQAAVQFIAMASKVLFGAVAMYLGWAVVGVLASYATLSVVLFLSVTLFKKRWVRRIESKELQHPALSPIVIFLCYLFLMTPFALDQILVQSLISGSSGEYAGLSALSKFVFYAVTPIVWVLYSYLINRRDDPKAFSNYAVAGVGGTALCAFALASLISLLPHSVVAIILSDRYQSVFPYLPRAAFTYGLYAASYGMILTLIAAGKRTAIVPLVFTFAVQIFLFSIYCSDTVSAVNIQLATNAILLLSTSFVFIPQVLKMRKVAYEPAK